ncbi:hypothetical protein LSAT2_011529 [Lamellibrachia satsuma]|nr:hypothetical protein LSAT2_011529 [Lamellibrachia satsuma]
MLLHRKTMLALFGVIAYSVITMLSIFTYQGHIRLGASDKSNQSASYNFTTTVEKHVQLITLFTTFKNFEAKAIVYRNTIRNWGLLAPAVRPVLYYTVGENSFIEFARMHGWAVYRCPKAPQVNDHQVKPRVILLNSKSSYKS